MASPMKLSGKKRSYSAQVISVMTEDGYSDETKLVQATIGEFHQMIPHIAAPFGNFRSQQHLVVHSVSSNNLQSVMRASQVNLQKLGRDTSEASQLDPAKQLRSMVDKRSGVTLSLLAAVVVALLVQFLNGYNCAVLNAPADVVFTGHSTLAWALAVSGFAVGGPFGAMVAGSYADKHGRKQALIVCTWIYFFGGLIMAGAPSMTWLIAARPIIGFASGFSSVLVPIYMGELAPPTLRGFFGTCTQFALVNGILVATLLGFPLATPSGWRLLFAISPLTCAVALLFMGTTLLESPVWLLRHDPDSPEANSAIQKLYGLQSDEEVHMEANHIIAACGMDDYDDDGLQAMEMEEELQVEVPDGFKGGMTMSVYGLNGPAEVVIPEGMAPGEKWIAILPSNESKGQRPDHITLTHLLSVLCGQDPMHLRPLVITAIVLHLAQQFSGINAIFYYSTSFFVGVIDNPLLGSALVAAINVVATMLATMLMDSFSRRSLMLSSLMGMLVSTIVVVAALLGILPNMAALCAVMTFVFFFEIGLGPIPWLIVAEMFESKCVAPAQSLSCQVNWLCNFIVGVGFPYLQQYLGPYSFAPFGVILLGSFCFVLFLMPETLGKSPKEVSRDALLKWADSTYMLLHLHKVDNEVEMTSSYSAEVLNVYKRRMQITRGDRSDSSSSFLEDRTASRRDSVEEPISF